MESQEKVVPVIAEELVIGKEAVKTGAVRVEKHVREHTEHIDLSLMREQVEVRRVPVNRMVEAIPSMREEGDTIIVPVVEEEVEIRTRLILKEEIHIVRRRDRVASHQEVTVRHEEAKVVRTDAQGGEVAPAKRPRLTQRPLGSRG